VAPPPTGVIVNNAQGQRTTVPASDLFRGADGQSYVLQGGQYYPLNNNTIGSTPSPNAGNGLQQVYGSSPVDPNASGGNTATQNVQQPVGGANGYAQWLQTPGSDPTKTGSLTLGNSVLPQINTSNVAQNQANPLQPSYVTAPTAQATTFQGAQLGDLNPQTLSAITGQAAQYGGAQLGQIDPSVLQMFSPDAAVQQLYSQFQPAAAQATRSLNDNLAAMGLVGGPALNAQTNLQQQLTSGLGQSLAGVIQNSQGNQLSALNTQAGLNQQTGLSNQSAINNMTTQNNANALSAFGTQAGLNQQTGLANQNAVNSFTQQNLSNLFGANQYNATAGNDANAAYANALQAAYNNNLANFQTMNQAGYSGATNLAGSGVTGSQNLAGQVASNYPVQSGLGSAFSNLGSAIGYGQNLGGGGASSGGGGADMSNASFSGW
jgi:hypothetical protein